ncbi:MAG: hypothetical protein IH969_10125, partial [Candidatus Krumholzibacteriota bacterium]|nr:hypothetical protein [Candidatus Krumholzibacteriota bacterium]
SVSNLKVLPGVDVASIALVLIDQSATALSSDELLEAQADFDDWKTTRTVEFTGATGWLVVADLTSIWTRDPRRKINEADPEVYVKP